MNTDIRLLTSFKGHRKRIKLYRMLGPDAVLSLIDLWLTIAQDAPDGNIGEWTDEDIIIASGYGGNAAAYTAALIACGWLEKNEAGKYSIHDWNEHQGWASKAKLRSEAAKVAAEYRWSKRQNHLKKCGRNARASAPAMQTHQNRNAPSPIPSPNPSPNPLPTYVDKNTWSDYCEMRKKIKKPLTEVAIPRLLKKLARFNSQGLDVNEMLDDSIQNSWQGVYEPKQKGGNGSSRKEGVKKTMEIFARREHERQEREQAETNRPDPDATNSVLPS